MRTILPMLMLLAAPAAAVGGEPDTCWVPFTLTPSNQIRFAAQIDGHAAAAILDTGVTTSTVSRSFATAARHAVHASRNALTVSGQIAAGSSEHHTITFGPFGRHDMRLAVADLPRVATGGAAIDLLVGTDLTASYALDIDYPAHRFRLLPSGRLPFRGVIAPLRQGADWGFYSIDLTIGGTRINRIAVDTGDGTALTLSQAAAATLPSPPPMTTTLDYAIGGAVIDGLAVLPEIRSGTLAIRNIELRIEPKGGFAETTGMSGRIGSGVLRRYRVLLDPDAGRMVLAAGPQADHPPLRSTSGFLLGVRPDRLDVLHVMRGSPAEQAGWHAGDTICAVDGITVDASYDASALASWPVAAAGRIVRLRDCAGGERSVALRRFY